MKHPGKPDWGIGEVLENPSGNTVRIFFVEGGERRLDLSLVKLKQLTAAESQHGLLDNLKAPKSVEGIKFRSLGESIENFLTRYPKGFYGPTFVCQERDYKVSAHEMAQELLGKAAFRRLVEKGDWAECCKRALQVVNATNLIFPNEKMALKDGLRVAANQRAFAESLFELLHGTTPMQMRFEAFSAMLEEIQAAKWTIATYFTYLMYPSKYMFLKPAATQNAAEICRFELNYQSRLNWKTFDCLMKFSDHLRTELGRLKPRDFIDVQSFMWSISE